jgi:Cu-Zn family superoxide dismutase
MRFLILVFAMVMGVSTATAAEFSGVKSDVINNEGKTIGTFTLAGTNRGIVGRLELTAGALKPGWHAVHFHAVGDCSDTAKFENAKDHINWRHREHGLLNRKGAESGDLPNVFALADGSVHAEISS